MSLVRQCLEGGRLKEACQVVKHFQLQHEFPAVERQYQAHVVQRLLDKQLWPAAAHKAAGDPALQVLIEEIDILLPANHGHMQ
jgi:hypothetical protein